MDEDFETLQRSVAAPEDHDLGSALLHSMEQLGEVLEGCIEVPEALRAHARALAQGESRVPADGERIDFVARVREALAPPRELMALRSWLGTGLTRWLEQSMRGELRAIGFALRAPVDRCLDARRALYERHLGAAQAFARWYAEGLVDHERDTFAAASRVALAEAVDRWCALGCESDLRRYVATWQRSASGWAEAALGRGIELPTEDLGRLRALRVHVKELHARRVSPRQLPRAVAARMGVSVAEAQRLLKVHDAAAAAGANGEALRRRMSLIRPIAEAATSLERELSRPPSVDEIASRARVHPCLVELALDAAGGA